MMVSEGGGVTSDSEDLLNLTVTLLRQTSFMMQLEDPAPTIALVRMHSSFSLKSCTIVYSIIRFLHGARICEVHLLDLVLFPKFESYIGYI